MKKLGSIFLIAITISCNVSKQYTKKGDELFEMGLYEDAANYYYNALLIDNKNYLAKQALQKSGNIVLTNKISQFGKYVTQNNAEQAVFQYRNAQKYYNTVKSVGVELEWPSLYNDVYEDIKNDYVNTLYERGLEQMQQKKYEQAEKTFSKIADIDSNFKDVTVLRTVSLVEPMYVRANQMMQAENYKEAFRNFEKILQVDPTYKDTKILRDDALKKARTGVGVIMHSTNKEYDNTARQMHEYIMAALVKSKNPFLQVVDRKFFEHFLKEQELGMTGLISTESAARAGKMAGLKYILALRLSEYKTVDLPPKTDSVIAYEAFTESTPNPNGTYNYTTRFKKVNYADTYHKKSVYVRLFYELISTETSQIVSSEVFEETQTDEQHVFRYAGNAKNLYDKLPAGNFLPEPNKEWRNNFGEVQRKLIPIEDLQRDALRNIASKVSTEISIYIEK
ncbi:MAG: hypothetical protein ACK4K9_06530 [Bacteroidia bacterium]